MVCLVETYLNKFESKNLDRVFSDKIFHAAALGHSGGVMIGISQSIPWALTSSILDKEGCFVILKGKLNQSILYIVGVYAPNKSQATFWDSIFEALQDDLEAEVLKLGDFNATFDKRLDRSANSSALGFPTNFYRYIKERGMTDIWRHANKEKKDDTVFSNHHQTYSRIYAILVTERLTGKLDSPQTGIRAVSDHAPVTAKRFESSKISKAHFWCLNSFSC